MKYANCQEIQIGDRVSIGMNGGKGIVVCDFDKREFSDEYPAVEWDFLEKGVMVKTEKFGLIHYEETNFELKLLCRENGSA